MSTEIPVPDLLPPWSCRAGTRSRTTLLLTIQHESGATARVDLARCATGRLRDTYPVAAHDLELRFPDGPPPSLAAELLGVLVESVTTADSRCRRMIFAPESADSETIALARRAGFRYVVDVDLPAAELSLLVFEPPWVTASDHTLDHVPGT